MNVRPLLLCLTATAVLFAGCAGEDGDSGSQATTPTATATATATAAATAAAPADSDPEDASAAQASTATSDSAVEAPETGDAEDRSTDTIDGAIDEAIDDQPASDSADRPISTTRLVRLLPEATKSVAVVDFDVMTDATAGIDLGSIHGASDPVLAVFEPIDPLIATIAAAEPRTVLLARTVEHHVLLAEVANSAILVDAAPSHSEGDIEVFASDSGHLFAVLDENLVAVGSDAALNSIIDVATGTAPNISAAPFAPVINALDTSAPLAFAFAMAGLDHDRSDSGLTLDAAAAMTGSFAVAGDEIDGSIAFHTSNAAEFATAYNARNLAATAGDDPFDQPLRVDGPVVGELSQVVVPWRAPVDPSADELAISQARLKKLFVGMDAADYADRVADRDAKAWLDFVVLSERDAVKPQSPGSVYIRWEFKDQAAIEAFERDELPEGFRIAPTRFIESDDPEGEYFFALNLYNAGGGSIVGGARAEWDVFVHPPEGADPNAGVRPRFMVVEALAEEVSADSANLLTPAEPLFHDVIDRMVVSSVSRLDGEREIPVFNSSFPVPDPATAPVARFTREMAIGNDYIYWGHGVSDRVFYEATTFNHDAHLVDISQLTFDDQSPWARYLSPQVKDAVYYENTLRYVASPMANLVDSDFLDIEPEWRDLLIDFTTNGHQEGLMSGVVDQMFRGAGDPFIGVFVDNATPSTYLNFEITDPDGFEAMVQLPDGHTLAPTALLDGDEPRNWLTLSLLNVDGASEGARAAWTVYTDDGDRSQGNRPPSMMVIDLMTEHFTVAPAATFESPSLVQHEASAESIETVLVSDHIQFAASIETGGTTEAPLSLDWIEAGDNVCYLSGVCDWFYYDAETLDVPVDVATKVEVTQFAAPWIDSIDQTPRVVFWRDNAQEYAVKPWFNLDVTVDPLPFDGLQNPTHTVAGTGSLIGRTSDLVDSEYTYSGDVTLEDDLVTFAIDQRIDNQLGVANIYATGSFDLTTATGTQTVRDCVGPALMCSDIEKGASSFYTAELLDATDPGSITWQINAAIDLGDSFGFADSASSFQASGLG